MTRAKPLYRALAVLLLFSPIFWHNSAVLAQSLEQSDSQDAQQRQLQQLQQQGLQSPQSPPSSDLNQPSPFGQPVQRLPGQSDLDTAGAVGRNLPSLDEPVNPDTYICGPGDIFELNFWGLQNLRLRLVVDVEGRAFVPRVGYFDLRGKTLSEARRTLRAAAAKYYPRLSVEATLFEPRTFLVQVSGAVAHPASYPSRAIERVAKLIAHAGGFEPNATHRRIEIRHRDGSVDRADLLQFERTGDNRFNPHVLDGDAIQVGYEELAATIAGAVNRPGRYELTGTRDLAELVELAGGLAPMATAELPVGIVRWVAGIRQEQLFVPFGAAGALPSAKLEKEDAVRIPMSVDVQKSVYVIGAVVGANRSPGANPAAPGAAAESITPDDATSIRRVFFVAGETVRGLLDRVGGVGPLADLSRAYVLRDGSTIPVDLERLVIQRDLSVDREIVLGDTLVVPFKRRNILVEGAVYSPGSYPYSPNYGVNEYVALAGGPTRNAQPVSTLTMVTPSGEVKEYNKSLVVEPGSALVVPERHYSRAEVVQIGLSIASVLISGVAVLIAAKKI